MREILWRAMLDAEFNSRYWRCITEKYAGRDFLLKLFLALSASGTVAGWSIWADLPAIWKTMSATAALASIASPILGWSKKVELAATHAGVWADLRVRYADLWDKYRSDPKAAPLMKEFEQLKKVFLELEKKEPNLRIPADSRLAKKCQADVKRAKQLT